MGNLPFERTRYNPVRDTTPEEAERNKRRQSEQEAAQDQGKAGQKIPPAGGDHSPDEDEE